MTFFSSAINRRRIYDIINVLEALEMISKQSKNWYIWLGRTNLVATLAKLKVRLIFLTPVHQRSADFLPRQWRLMTLTSKPFLRTKRMKVHSIQTSQAPMTVAARAHQNQRTSRSPVIEQILPCFAEKMLSCMMQVTHSEIFASCETGSSCVMLCKTSLILRYYRKKIC